MTEGIENKEETSPAAEYVLGLLSAADARAFEDLMVTDPDARDAYAFWADHFGSLTDDIPAVAPPPTLWRKIEAATFGAAPKVKTSWFDRFGLGSAVGGGLIAALVALWMINVSGVMDWLDTPQYTAQIVAADSSLIVTASYDAGSNTLDLSRAAGAARDGRSLELWLIAGENAPVSLGLLSEAQNMSLTIDAALIPALDGGVLAISDEPIGGSPTGAPTGDVLAVGPIVTL